MSQKIPQIVLFHADCYDGFAAAWAIEIARAEANAPDITWVPVQYNKPLPPIDYRCELLYIVDFSLPSEQLDQLSALAGKIVILDHHKSAAEHLADVQKIYLGQDPMELPYDVLAHFDMEHSGAVLTWKHFRPEEGVPMLLQYIQDRDLWKWVLPESKWINAYIGANPMAFETFDRMNHELHKDRERVEAVGLGITQYQEKLIKQIIESARVTSFTMHDNVPVPCVAVRSPVLQSEVGNALCEHFPEVKFAIIYSDIPGDMANIKWSLRSIGEFDVTQITKRYGGGGHRNAGGMTTPTWRMV